MKKMLILFIILALLCAFATAEEAQRETYVSGDYTYALLDDGTAEITRYYGDDAKLAIPSVLDGFVVTAIGDNAFKGCDSLTSIIVRPDSFAKQYCVDHNLPYTYPDANDWLNG